MILLDSDEEEEQQPCSRRTAEAAAVGDDDSDGDDDDDDVDADDDDDDDDDDIDDIDDDCDEGDQPEVRKPKATKRRPASQKRPRGRPRKETISTASAQVTKLPGHSTFPINDFSLTVAKTKADVPLVLLEVVYDFITKYGIKGGVSTEVGHRAHNLHLQASFSMRFPKDRARIKELVKLLREEIKAVVHSLVGYKIQLKAFAARQSFLAMLGYITKDEG